MYDMIRYDKVENEKQNGEKDRIEACLSVIWFSEAGDRLLIGVFLFIIIICQWYLLRDNFLYIRTSERNITIYKKII